MRDLAVPGGIPRGGHLERPDLVSLRASAAGSLAPRAPSRRTEISAIITPLFHFASDADFPLHSDSHARPHRPKGYLTLFRLVYEVNAHRLRVIVIGGGGDAPTGSSPPRRRAAPSSLPADRLIVTRGAGELRSFA